jgi:prevent-host-death family protein
MTKVSVGETREHLADILNKAAFGHERTIIRRRNKEIAAVVPMADLEFLEAMENRIDLEDARKSLAEARKKGSTPWKKIKADLAL